MYDNSLKQIERSFCKKKGRKFIHNKSIKAQKDLFDAYSNLPELYKEHKSGSAYLKAGGSHHTDSISLRSKFF